MRAHHGLAWLVAVAFAAACSENTAGTNSPPDASSDATLDAPADVAPLDVAPVDVAPDAPAEAASDAADDAPAEAASDGGDDAADAPPEAAAGCASDADCAAGHGGAVCDRATGRCVECVPSADTCPAARHCDAATNRCVDGCRADEGCAMSAMTPRCDTTRNACVACAANEHCPAGRLCVGNECVAGCTDARPCPTGETCCGGACVDTQDNLAHCGACGQRCAAPNASPACRNGACAVAMCTGAFADCDMNAANGCEADTQTSDAHCGACGRACPSRPNARNRCGAGRCELTCEAGFADCDGDADNGCEVNLQADPAHCGACPTACAPPNGVAACAMGRCAVARCNEGFADCDMNATNGCEADTRINVSHCGACGRACEARANAFPGCLNGACVTSCVMGYQDCDGNPANGCEADIRADGNNCGACGRACGVANTTTGCAAGRCEVRSCAAGYADCDGMAANGCEVNTLTDVAHCARCNNRCVVAGGTAACVAGACGLSMCAAGRGDCNRMAGDGCETDLATSAMHCGACGAACALPNATASCAGGRCAVMACAMGFADCDGNPANGCEVNLGNNPGHCGRCGNACNLAGATSACAAGQCVITACDAGRADCDRTAATGCEVDTRVSTAHCGGCGVACATPNATAACAAGACRVGSCNGGFADCNGAVADGCEASLAASGVAPARADRRFAPAGSGRDQTPSEDICVEVGPRGEVYVLSYNDKVIVFDADGNFLRNYPARGWSTAWSIAVDREAGDMWVVDPNNSTVVHLTPAGNPSESWSAGLSGARGVEYARGEVFVSDYGNNRVVVYGRTGTMLRNFRSAGLSSPRGLTVGASGNVYVTSSGNNTLRVFNAAGVEQRAFNVCNTPSDVAVDECRGVVYVLCEAGDQWVAYRPDGTRLYSVATEGGTSHSGIAVSPDGARLYVSHAHGGGRATLLYRR